MPARRTPARCSARTAVLWTGWTPCCSRSSRGSTCGSRCSEAGPSSLRVGPGRVLRRQFASTTPPLLSPTVGHDLALLTWEAHVRRGRGTTDVGPLALVYRERKGPRPRPVLFVSMNWWVLSRRWSACGGWSGAHVSIASSAGGPGGMGGRLRGRNSKRAVMRPDEKRRLLQRG